MDKCTETSLQDAKGCKMAISNEPEEYWTAAGNLDESVTVKFKERVKPQQIWIAQPADETNMAAAIKIFISADE